MFRVAIVGAGPAGCSLSLRLLKSNRFQVNLFDRSLAPWGLLRTGVAPDHPEVKHTAASWESISSFSHFQFHGGVNVNGTADLDHGILSCVSLDKVVQSHDTVVLCNGAYATRRLGIPGQGWQLHCRKYFWWKIRFGQVLKFLVHFVLNGQSK